MLSMRPDGHLPGISHSHRWQFQHPPDHISTSVSKIRVFWEVNFTHMPSHKRASLSFNSYQHLYRMDVLPTPGNRRYHGSCTPGTHHPLVWHATPPPAPGTSMLVSPLQGQGHIYSFIWLIHPCLFFTIRAHLCFILFPTASPGHRVGVNNLFFFLLTTCLLCSLKK